LGVQIGWVNVADGKKNLGMLLALE